MRTKNTIVSFGKIFLIVDIALAIFALIVYDSLWLLNTQIAFLGSLFVTITSFLSYRKNIQNRLSNFDSSKVNSSEDRDKVDEIDDPYDLYTEYEEIPEEQLTPEKIKEIINEEKSKVKKDSFKNTIFSATGFVSIYRILGYGFLILGFFALNNNKLFLPIPFLVGLAVVPISVIVSKAILKEEASQ
ncbi:MAG: hypothetical protein ACNI25_08305 [Halarcobacter sp.]